MKKQDFEKFDCRDGLFILRYIVALLGGLLGPNFIFARSESATWLRFSVLTPSVLLFFYFSLLRMIH